MGENKKCFLKSPCILRRMSFTVIYIEWWKWTIIWRTKRHNNESRTLKKDSEEPWVTTALAKLQGEAQALSSSVQPCSLFKRFWSTQCSASLLRVWKTRGYFGLGSPKTCNFLSSWSSLTIAFINVNDYFTKGRAKQEVMHVESGFAG